MDVFDLVMGVILSRGFFFEPNFLESPPLVRRGMKASMSFGHADVIWSCLFFVRTQN